MAAANGQGAEDKFLQDRTEGNVAIVNIDGGFRLRDAAAAGLREVSRHQKSHRESSKRWEPEARAKAWDEARSPAAILA